jgi:hypothetical protein
MAEYHIDARTNLETCIALLLAAEIGIGKNELTLQD